MNWAEKIAKKGTRLRNWLRKRVVEEKRLYGKQQAPKRFSTPAVYKLCLVKNPCCRLFLNQVECKSAEGFIKIADSASAVGEVVRAAFIKSDALA